MHADSRFKRDEFVVKLNNCSGSHYGDKVKFVKGVDGIFKAIDSWIKNKRVFGYYSEVVIQPTIPNNTQVSVLLFDGVAMIQNTNK